MDAETLKKMREGGNGLFTNGASPIDLSRLSRWWDKLRGKEPAKPEAKPDYKPTHELVKDVGSIGINVVRHESGSTHGGERKLPGELVDFYMTQLDKMVVGMRDMIIKGYNQAGLFPNSADRWRAAGLTNAAGVVDPNFLVETNLFDLVTDNEGNMDKDKVKKILTSGTGNRDHFIKLIQTHIDQDTSRLFSRIGIRQSLNPTRLRNYVDHSRLFLNLDRGTANQLLVDALKSALEQITTRGGRKFRPDAAGYATIVAALLATPLMGFVGASAAAGLAASLGVAYHASLGAALGVTAANVLNTIGVTSLTAGGAALGGGLVPFLAGLRSSIFRQGVTVNNNAIGAGLQGQMTEEVFADPARRTREEKYLQQMHGVDMSGAALASMTPQRAILERGMVAVVARLMYRQAIFGETQGAADAMLDDGILLARPGDRVNLEGANLTMNNDIKDLLEAEYRTIAAARGLDPNAFGTFPSVDQDQHRAAMLEALRIARGRYAVREAQELHLEVIKLETTAETKMESDLKTKLEVAARPDEYADGSINVDDLVDQFGNLRSSASIDSEADEGKKKKLKSLALFRNRATAIASALVPPGPNPIEAYQRYRKQREHVFTKGDKKVIDDLRSMERSGNKSREALEIERQLFGASNLNQEEVIALLEAVINGNEITTDLPTVNLPIGSTRSVDLGILISAPIANLYARRINILSNGIAPARSVSSVSGELSTCDMAIQNATNQKSNFESVYSAIQTRAQGLSRKASLTTAEAAELPVLNTWLTAPVVGTFTAGGATYTATVDRATYDAANLELATRSREKAQLEGELRAITAQRDAYVARTDKVLEDAKKSAIEILAKYKAALGNTQTTEETKRVAEFTTECRAAYSEITIGPAPRQLGQATLEDPANTVDVLVGLATAAGFWTAAEQNRPENRAKLQRARVWALARERMTHVRVGPPAIAVRTEPDNTDIREAVERESVSLDALISTQHTRLMDARQGVDANRDMIKNAQEVNERRKVVADSQEHINKLVHDFTEARQTNPATRYDVVYDPAVTAAETNYQTLHTLPPIYFTLLNYLVGYTGDAAKRSRSFTTASAIYTPNEMRDLLRRLPLLNTPAMAGQPFHVVAAQLGTYLASGQITAVELRRELRNRANQHVNAAINI